MMIQAVDPRGRSGVMGGLVDGLLRLTKVHLITDLLLLRGPLTVRSRRIADHARTLSTKALRTRFITFTFLRRANS
jgi:hypothetical protein